MFVLQAALDSANARANDPSMPRTSGTSPSSPSDSFDPNAHLHQEHTIAAHRRYLNFEGVGYGSQEQRQAQYRIHKLERAFDRVSEYRANKLMDEASEEFVKERKKGGMSAEEEEEHAMAQMAIRHQRQAKRKASEPRRVEEMIDAALVDWAAEAPTLSAFGRPFTPQELMMGASTQDILTQRLNRVMKNVSRSPRTPAAAVSPHSSSHSSHPHPALHALL